jgi:hypothetical protein
LTRGHRKCAKLARFLVPQQCRQRVVDDLDIAGDQIL